MSNETGIIWYRNDLRVEDHVGLKLASEKHQQIVGVYCFDPRQFETLHFETSDQQISFKKTEKYRANFLIESIHELKENLANYNIPLFVYLGKPEDKIPELINQFNCSHIYFQKEWTPEEALVTDEVKNNTEEQKVTWIENYDQFLFHPNDIPFPFKEIPAVFTVFRKQLEKEVAIKPTTNIKDGYSQLAIENNTEIPNLSDLGFERFSTPAHNAFPFKGGENQAKKRLKDYLWNTKKLSLYKKTRNGLIGTDYSSKFSAWLANGTISAKIIYREIKKYEKEIVKNQSTYWLIFELIWRDYFKYVSLKHRNKIFKIDGILENEYSWSIDTKNISKWINGSTNNSFVDANMLELQKTGWMSNRGRQNVASYFAKELCLDWRIGGAYFEAMLIDYDVHSNYGNWMYVAGVGNDPRNRKFNTQLQAERYDPNGKFQRLWLQETLF